MPQPKPEYYLSLSKQLGAEMQAAAFRPKNFMATLRLAIRQEVWLHLEPPFVSFEAYVTGHPDQCGLGSAVKEIAKLCRTFAEFDVIPDGDDLPDSGVSLEALIDRLTRRSRGRPRKSEPAKSEEVDADSQHAKDDGPSAEPDHVPPQEKSDNVLKYGNGRAAAVRRLDKVAASGEVEVRLPTGKRERRKLSDEELAEVRQKRAEVLSGKMTAHSAMVALGFRKQPTAKDQIRKAWPKVDDADRADLIVWMCRGMDESELASLLSRLSEVRR